MTKHNRIQMEIVSACRNMGIEAIQEYKGTDWRADVFIPNNGKPIAFEIQMSPQSLKKTLERQAKYIRDGINGCWLFENPIAKLNTERPDLPVFYVRDAGDSNLIVQLGDRGHLKLSSFLRSFISEDIQFRTLAKTKVRQSVSLVFYEMDCWNCKAENHLFYVDSPFYSACNAIIKPDEALWESNSMEYRPEIIELAEKFVKSRPDLKLGQIKQRHSNMVENSYMSFGCYSCDRIFGDFYVMDAKLGVMYETEELAFQGEIELREDIILTNIPHWCYGEGKQFCGEVGKGS
ncbi:MAG: hypothetical protein ACLGH8_03300 [Bacteroidia bacterium]